MNKKTQLIFSIFIFSALLLGACNLPSRQSPEDANATTVAETANAVFTKAAETAAVTVPSATTEAEPEATKTPTNTPPPTTAAATATNTPIPCNRASFVEDVNYPDDTEVAAGSTFTKTWRLKNNGSCSWTSGYVLLFDSGDQMGAPATSTFTSGTVSPGSTVDISVDLTAPSSPGTYQGRFKLRSSDNIVFGINGDAQGSFWVKVVVPDPTPTPTEPDLVVTNLTFNPDPPKQGVFMDVSVTIKNQGDTDAGAFDVEWKGGENFATPSCTWSIPSLAGGGSVTKSCNSFQYSSWYANITTVVTADVGDTVDESDETNNELKMDIEVEKP